MTISDPKLRSDLEGFARLLSSAQAWLADLEATQEDIRKHLDSPIGRAILQGNGDSDGMHVIQDEGLDLRDPLTLLQQLESCTKQEQVCEVLGRANRGTIVLKDSVPHIRRAGLAKETTTDSGITKNLGSRLIETGRWDRVRPGVYALRGFPTSKNSTAGGLDGQSEPSDASGDDPKEGILPGTSLDTCPSGISSCPGLPHECNPLSSEFCDISLL